MNGPNLNLLGTREPEVYGSATLADLEGALEAIAKSEGAELECFQSNVEGELVDALHRAAGVKLHEPGLAPSGECAACVFNPGALRSQSVRPK